MLTKQVNDGRQSKDGKDMSQKTHDEFKATVRKFCDGHLCSHAHTTVKLPDGSKKDLLIEIMERIMVLEDSHPGLATVSDHSDLGNDTCDMQYPLFSIRRYKP